MAKKPARMINKESIYEKNVFPDLKLADALRDLAEKVVKEGTNG
jgi:hypothetical protein